MLRRLAGRIVLRPPLLLLPLLIPLSLIYRMAAAVHRWIYRSGLMRSASLPRPVVSIGNLAVGGGGKTPLTMWLAETLKARGQTAGVLTRGYGRSGDGGVIARPEHDWKRLGDEPALMVRRVVGLPVAVSKNRKRGGEEMLREKNVDLFILDDGFSHHALYKDLEVVVIDDNRRFGSGRLLPAGILRDPPGRLKDAHLIVVTKAVKIDREFEKEIGKYTGVPVLWADYRPEGLVPLQGGGATRQEPVPEGPFLGFCGVADPEGFRSSLERAGVDVVEFCSFPDHHPYSASDVSSLMEKALARGAKAFVTTEKDGVRWPQDQGTLPCFSLAMGVVFLEGETALVDAVTSMVRQSGRRRR